MINQEVLNKMKVGSYLVNLSRGGVVDESGLYKALINGKKLAGAALDVHKIERPGHIPQLASLPNVILTPHIGANSVESQLEIGNKIVEIVKQFERNSCGNNIKNVIIDEVES
jgi:phosphoglycerate dehydrogenase-like enzyme